MDFSLANALTYNMGNISRVINFYDINCSYMKRLRARVDSNQFIGIPEGFEIIPGIGIWHVHGHRLECFAQHAPLFIPGVGWVDGEIIETLWSTLNIVSGSAQGMSSPHHQELLDFQMNDSNFMKMVCMTHSLKRKLCNARHSSACASAAFDELDAAVAEEQRGTWAKQERAAQEKRVLDPSAMDIFDVQVDKGESEWLP